MITFTGSSTLFSETVLSEVNKDSCNAFVNTFSAVDMSFYSKQGLNLKVDPNSKNAAHSNIKKAIVNIAKVQVETMKEERKTATLAEGENDKFDDSANKNGSSSATGISDYINELPKGHEAARACEFASQTEEVYANLYGFKYMLNTKVLKNSNKYNEILRF